MITIRSKSLQPLNNKMLKKKRHLQNNRLKSRWISQLRRPRQ